LSQFFDELIESVQHRTINRSMLPPKPDAQ
jgi:hypothetical protein